MHGFSSGILHYIIENQLKPGDRLPTISELSQQMGVSVGKVREELEVARTLGILQVKPRIGMVVLDFDFGPAATLMVLYALGQDRASFHQFALLRKSVELSFWHEAVSLLTPSDIDELRQLIICARDKLNRAPVVVPVEEHRRLHLAFFKHLQNPFVLGLLEAYWAAYKAHGLALYAELSYHREVWDYHERMVECVARKDFEAGRRALKEHMELLRHMPQQAPSDAAPPSIRHMFE